MNELNRAERKKKLKIRYAVVKNRDIIKNIPEDDLKAEVLSDHMTKYLGKISTGEIKTERSKNYTPQSTCGQLYDPYDVSFTFWLFRHLHNTFKDKNPTNFIENVIEPECIVKLYSDKFGTSEADTNAMLYETAVLAAEADEGITFEESCKALKRNLDVTPPPESSTPHTREVVAIALYDFKASEKNHLSFNKEDLLVVFPTDGKWCKAKKEEVIGWVPQNYIFPFNETLTTGKAKKDYNCDQRNSLSFSKNSVITIHKQNLDWAVGQIGNNIGYFPLKYVTIQD